MAKERQRVGERCKQDRAITQTEEEDEGAPTCPSHSISEGQKNKRGKKRRNTFQAEKAILSLEIGRCLLVGQLTKIFLPVMKVVTGVNALGGNGGLFIPLKAERHTCFAWSVICNCGIS